MKSCNDAGNVSNDGEDDAYDTLPGHNHFLVLPWPGNGGADVGLRNSENWICTDTRQTSHKTLLLKVKVSRSAIFCFWPPLIPCCKLVQISREMKLCRAFWPQAGSVWRVSPRYITTPFPHCSYVTTCHNVTYVMCYVKNCTESRKKPNCQSLPLWDCFQLWVGFGIIALRIRDY